MNRVMALYYSMLEKYGKQGWWPAETPYEVVVGAVLTQNTNWRNVERAIKNLKQGNVLSPSQILGMRYEKLKNLIRPAGFYNQKAERLRLATKAYAKLSKKAKCMDRMELRKELLAIKGIGRETADSIILYAFDKPIFVIDAYTRRFCLSHGLFHGKDYEGYREFFERRVPKDVGIYKEYHALIVEWGKAGRKGKAKI